MDNLPSYIDAELWTDFIEGRKEMQTKNRIPFTAVAQKRILAKLEKFHDQGIDANQCLEDSICNSWRSVFPPKGCQTAQNARQPVSFAQSDREAGMARWEARTGRIHPDRVPTLDMFTLDAEGPYGITHQSH